MTTDKQLLDHMLYKEVQREKTRKNFSDFVNIILWICFTTIVSLVSVIGFITLNFDAIPSVILGILLAQALNCMMILTLYTKEGKNE